MLEHTQACRGLGSAEKREDPFICACFLRAALHPSLTCLLLTEGTLCHVRIPGLPHEGCKP